MSNTEDEPSVSSSEMLQGADVDVEWEKTESGWRAYADPITLVISDQHIYHPDSIVGGVRPFDGELRQLDADTVEEAKREIERKAIDYLEAAALGLQGAL